MVTALIVCVFVVVYMTVLGFLHQKFKSTMAENAPLVAAIWPLYLLVYVLCINPMRLGATIATKV